jgi:hypothetical protein
MCLFQHPNTHLCFQNPLSGFELSYCSVYIHLGCFIFFQLSHKISLANKQNLYSGLVSEVKKNKECIFKCAFKTGFELIMQFTHYANGSY